MGIVANSQEFYTLSDVIIANNTQVLEVYANNVLVYPEGTLAPASIKIVVPPTKTSYWDNETIDYTGTVVMLYDAFGRVFTDAAHPDGIVPHSELVFDVTKADATQARYIRTSTLDTNWAQPIETFKYLYMEWTRGSWGTEYVEVVTEKDAVAFAYPWGSIDNYHYSEGTYVRGLYNISFASSKPGPAAALMTKWFHDPVETTVISTSDSSSRSREYFGKTVYTTGNWASSGWPDVPVPTFYPRRIDNPTVYPNFASFWTAIYGDASENGQSIPVKWVSTYDQQVLQDSFSIAVYGSSRHGIELNFDIQ